MSCIISQNVTMPTLFVSQSHDCRRKFQTLLWLYRGITSLGTIVRLHLVEGLYVFETNLTGPCTQLFQC